MREIKFRAWNRKEKCWHYFNLVDLIIGRAQEAGSLAYEKWCEFTGLRDKNGKEIYEGNVIQYGYITSDDYILERSRTTGVVKWFDDIAGFKPEDLRINHKGGRYRSVWDFCEELEVIGDIYENPELLKDKKP